MLAKWTDYTLVGITEAQKPLTILNNTKFSKDFINSKINGR